MVRTYPTDSGNLVLGVVTMTSITTTGNATIGGDLDVSGSTTLVATTTAGLVQINDNYNLQFEGVAADLDGLTLNCDNAGDAVISVTAGKLSIDTSDGILDTNSILTFDTGVVTVAASYSVGRNADATNLMQYNVPTGASHEISVNDVGVVTIGAGNVHIKDVSAYSLGNTAADPDAELIWETADADSHYLNLIVRRESRNFIFSEDSDIDWGHAVSTNPTFFIHSSDSTDTTDWLSFAHNQTSGAITSGNGGINLASLVGFGQNSPTHAATFPTASTGIALHNVADQTTNYERGVIAWDTNVLTIGNKSNGSGTNRMMRLFSDINSGARTKMEISRTAIPFVYVNWDNTAFASPAGAFLYTGGFVGDSVAQTFLGINPTYNQTGTASGTDFLINRTETAVGSGAHNFIDFQAGSVSKWRMTNAGLGVYSSTATGWEDYNTADETTNFEKAQGKWGSNIYTLGMEAGGSGLNRVFRLESIAPAGGYTRMDIKRNAAPFVSFDYGATIATGNHYEINFAPSGSSGSQNGLVVASTYAQTGTASGTDLLINRTETTVGSGTQRLLDLQVGSISKFSVSNKGNIDVFQLLSGIGLPKILRLTPSSNTGITASTDNPQVQLAASTQTWATGALAESTYVDIGAETIAFAGASVVSAAYGLKVLKPIAGTNATLTKTLGIYAEGIEVVGSSILTGAVSGVTTLGMSGDLTISGNTANITHSGTTSLTITSTSGTVGVESVVFTDGAISSVTSITDGTASWSSNSLSGFTSISGTTLTDGTFSVSSGAISGVTTLGMGGALSGVTTLGTSGTITHTLGATDKVYIDATSTPNTQTEGVLDINFTTATDGTRGIYLNTSVTGDLTGAVEMLKLEGGMGTAQSNGEGMVGSKVSISANAGDSDGFYIANEISINKMGGTSETEAIDISGDVDYIIVATSGDIQFVDYAPVIETYRESAGAGDTLTVRAGDGLTSGAGGVLRLYGGVGASAADGYVKVGQGAGTPTATLTDDDMYVVGSIEVDKLYLGAQGTDLASANDMVVPTANYCDVTGTTQINTMAATSITVGTFITLQFDGSVTVKHATAGAGAQFQLAASGDFSATVGDTLMLVYDGTYWREVARTAI